MSGTVSDFWRMIWEHKPTTLVMLTKQVEGGKVGYKYHTLVLMCAKYLWPGCSGREECVMRECIVVLCTAQV